MFFEDKYFISNKIRLARKKAKITQEELSEKIGITSKQLSRIEAATHMPSLITFLRIVNILNINMNDLGIYNKTGINPIHEQINKILSNSTDEELLFYFNILTSLKNNMNLLKK